MALLSLDVEEGLLGHPIHSILQMTTREIVLEGSSEDAISFLKVSQWFLIVFRLRLRSLNLVHKVLQFLMLPLSPVPFKKFLNSFINVLLM